jgi:hypothetical protein
MPMWRNPMLEREQRTNRLLTLLSADDYDRLRPHLTKGELDYKQILYEAARRLCHIAVERVAKIRRLKE